MNHLARIEKEEDPLLLQAADWALEMSDNATLERVDAWQRWLCADERHREAFSRMEHMLTCATRVRPPASPGSLEIAADAYDGAMSVSRWKDHPLATRRSKRTRRFAVYATAATVLVSAMLVTSGYPRKLTVPGLFSYDRVETPAGGRRKLTLTDGSSVDIGGKSSLSAFFTQHSRSVTIRQGEAFFEVAKEATRPFTVQAGDTTITAIGTAFNVRRSGERVVVSVAAGAVRVDAPASARSGMRPTANLAAGQQLEVEPRTRELVLASIEATAVAGWRNGRLRYIDEPLSSVIADVARHTGREIELEQPSIGELRITGTVLENNLKGWLTSLEETFDVNAIHQQDGRIRLTFRADSSPSAPHASPADKARR